MARIRSIKPDFWTSEQILECSPGARLLFIGMWTVCDDAGRHPWSPKELKAKIYPSDQLGVDDVEAMMRELQLQGLIARYTAAGKDYFYVTGWHHQKIDRPRPPRYPDPDENSSNDRRRVVEESSNDRRMLDEQSSNDQRTVVEASPNARRTVVEQSSIEGLQETPQASEKQQFDERSTNARRTLDDNSSNDRRRVATEGIRKGEEKNSTADRDLSQSSSARAAGGGTDDAAAIELIEIVDQAIEAAFSARRRRPWPHPRDGTMAARWLADGISPATVRHAAQAVCRRLAAQGKEPPRTLEYLDRPVREAHAGPSGPTAGGGAQHQQPRPSSSHPLETDPRWREAAELSAQIGKCKDPPPEHKGAYREIIRLLQAGDLDAALVLARDVHAVVAYGADMSAIDGRWSRRSAKRDAEAGHLWRRGSAA